MSRLLIAGFLVGGMTVLVVGQAPTYRTRADLVQVDVAVEDAGGNPVQGLTAADFVLRDRGKPQTISTFQEIAHEQVPAQPAFAALVRKDVSNNQASQSDRLVIVVVDDLHIYTDRTERAKGIARDVLESLGAGSSLAVLFTSGQHSTQVTDDEVVLRAAVNTLKGRQSWRRPHVASDAMTGPRIDVEESADAALSKLQQKQDASAQDFFENIRSYKVLQDAARILESSDRRRKAFVLISEGVGKDLSGLFGAMDPAAPAPEGGSAYAFGNVEALTLQSPATYHDFALLDMMEALRRASVSTYAIDPRGKVGSRDLARECFPAPHPGNDPCSEGLTDWASPVRQAQHGLEIMSEASGGFAITNTDDFTSGLDRIARDLDHYYLLGFYPPDVKGKDYRPLQVTVPGRPDLRLRFRRGYRLDPPSSPVKRASGMMALSSGVLPNAGLPLRLSAMPMPKSGPDARVVLVLEVSLPRSAIDAGGGHLRDTLKYEVLVVDEKKARIRSLGGLEAAFALSRSTAATGAVPESATFQATEAVDLPPGSYEFRVSAAIAALGKSGSVYLAVEVPDFGGRAAALGGLEIGYSDGPRVPMAPRRAAPGMRGAQSVPTERPLLPFAPSLDRVFKPQDTLRVYAEGTLRDASARPTVSVEVLDRSGHVVASPSPSYSVSGIVKIEGLVALENLRPGAYVLRVKLVEATGASVTRETPFAVN